MCESVSSSTAVGSSSLELVTLDLPSGIFVVYYPPVELIIQNPPVFVPNVSTRYAITRSSMTLSKFKKDLIKFVPVKCPLHSAKHPLHNSHDLVFKWRDPVGLQRPTYHVMYGYGLWMESAKREISFSKLMEAFLAGTCEIHKKLAFADEVTDALSEVICDETPLGAFYC